MRNCTVRSRTPISDLRPVFISTISHSGIDALYSLSFSLSLSLCVSLCVSLSLSRSLSLFLFLSIARVLPRLLSKRLTPTSSPSPTETMFLQLDLNRTLFLYENDRPYSLLRQTRILLTLSLNSIDVLLLFLFSNRFVFFRKYFTYLSIFFLSQ